MRINNSAWYVAMPTNQLEGQMWGDEGLPKMDTSVEDNRLKIRLASRVRKQRSGLGKYAIRKSWVQRWLVLAGQKIFYFELSDKTEQEIMGYPSWLDQVVATYDDQEHIQGTHKLPRGVFDLLDEDVLYENTLHPSTGRRKSVSTPTMFSIDLQKTRGDHLEKWKVCFESETEQREWMEALQEIVGVQDDGIQFHGFEPGDHIIRWELVPIAWPIQIHGIVLEAGRNCVIIADFGVTAQVDGKTVKISEQEEIVDENHEIIGAASKFRSKEKQRLNVKVLTDKTELRKWTKVNYGRNVFDLSAGGTFGQLKKWFRKPPKSATNTHLSASNNSLGDNEWLDEAVQCTDANASFEMGSMALIKAPPVFSIENIAPNDSSPTQDSLLRASIEIIHGLEQEIQDNNKNLLSLESPQMDQSLEKLPKSDPTKIVLARTNFLLEFGEDVLPPYHLFYSNSECIAVWCKTGRWSTLQAAIFLHSTAIGNAKSATVVTIGVAASHMVLLPVLAVGGLAMVTAPWIILKRCKEKWEEATSQLNDGFWAWAEPEVFVAAIESWSGLVST